MVTFILLIFAGIIFGTIKGYEWWKKNMAINKAADKQQIDPAYISEETRDIIRELKDVARLKVDTNLTAFKLSTGQYLFLDPGNLKLFKSKSRLNYEPSEFDWKVLAKVVLDTRKYI